MTAPQSSIPPVHFGRSSAGQPKTPAFGFGGALAGILVAALLIGGMVWSAASGRAARGERPLLFGGSLVLEDSGHPLPVLDVATAKITLRLQGVNTQVGASRYSDVQAVGVDGGTMLVNRRTGAFNLLGNDNYLVDPIGSGVGLGPLRSATGAEAFAAGPAAYIVRFAPKSTVSLVDRATVAAAARLQALPSNGPVPGRRVGITAAPAQAVAPRGFAALGGSVRSQPGSAAVSEGDLWTLVASGPHCTVDELHPVAEGSNGLQATDSGVLDTECSKAAVEATSTTVAVAFPGTVRIFPRDGAVRARAFSVPGTLDATRFLPVTGATRDAWFLALSPQGWSAFSVTETGKVTGPLRLQGLGPRADPVDPVAVSGILYTLDQAATGQPTLWTVESATGGMAPVPGATTYPAFNASEKAGFAGAQVLVDGPRVVFNNPQSLEAVVVFTDGSHAPVVVDKSNAVTVSATGPADLDVTGSPRPSSVTARRSPNGAGHPGLVQAINPQLSCASTAQKPYAPQITSVSPSSGSALVAWSYQLIDETDCEPRSWAVEVKALSGAHQPRQPVQVVEGQLQDLFTGLRPSTTYQVVVTAYINSQSTRSSPTTFRTSPRGPDAPLTVATTQDGRGDWTVSWEPCTEAAHPNCVVPADVWTVIGAACGTSVVDQLPSVQTAGNRTSLTINSDALGLLGDSLSFSVQGSLISGLAGNPTSDHSCTEAWRPPAPQLVRVAGAGIPSGQTVTATIQVTTIGRPVEALGSRSTQFVYHVGSATLGPTASTTVSIPGLEAGEEFTPSVSIYPSGHPSAAVTIAGKSFRQTLPWPHGLAVAVSPTVDPADPNQGDVQLSFPGLPAGPMNATWSYVCGATGSQTAQQAVDNGSVKFTLDLVDAGGTCTLSSTISDTGTPDPYGVSSPLLSNNFSIGTQPTYVFTDQISPNCQQNFCVQEQLQVDSSSGGPLLAGGDWTYAVRSSDSHGDVDPCAVAASSMTAPPTFPMTVTLPVTCVDPRRADVTISYRYLGQTIAVDAGTPSGPPPATTTTTTTTTLPQCETTTTTAPSTTATTAPCTTTTTTAAAAAPATALSSFSTSEPRVPGDPQVRQALQWSIAALGAGWIVSRARSTHRGRRAHRRRAHRRRNHRRRTHKEVR